MSKPYRVFLYVLGHIRTADIVYARSDGEALAKAAAVSLPAQAFEIWESGRFVGRSPAVTQPSCARAERL